MPDAARDLERWIVAIVDASKVARSAALRSESRGRVQTRLGKQRRRVGTAQSELICSRKASAKSRADRCVLRRAGFQGLLEHDLTSLGRSAMSAQPASRVSSCLPALGGSEYPPASVKRASLAAWTIWVISAPLAPHERSGRLEPLSALRHVGKDLRSSIRSQRATPRTTTRGLAPKPL